MNIVSVNLGSEFEFINLYPVADVHIGSAHYLKNKFKHHVDVIKNDNNAVVVLNGDLINNAIRNSVSNIYDEDLTPEESIELLIEVLEPIKEKIIGITMGNHEKRTYKETGIDIMKYVAYRLGIVDRYDPIANVIFLSFGQNRRRKNIRNTFSIYQTHGSGGGRTIGSKANYVERLSHTILADIYIHSHTHIPIIFKEDFYQTDCRYKNVKKVSKLFVNTNAYEGYGGYGQEKNYNPPNHDFIIIKLKANSRGKKQIRALL